MKIHTKKIRNRKEKPQHKQKIRNKLYIIYFLAIFLPVVLLGSYLVLNTRALLLEQDYATIESDNLRVKNIMVDMTTSINRIGTILLQDDELQKVLSANWDTTEEAYDAYRHYYAFEPYQSHYTEVGRIEIYVDKDVEYGNFKKITPKVKQEEWYQKAMSTARPIWCTLTSVNTNKSLSYDLCFVQRLPIVGTGKYGVLMITINSNHMRSRINNNVLHTDITVNNDAIFYSNTGKKGEELNADIDYTDEYYSFIDQAEYQGDEVLMRVSTFMPIYTTDKIYIVTTDPDALPYTRRITYICIGMILLSIIVPFILIGTFTNSFSKRIVTLRHAMHKASMGDYSITEKLTGNDELSDAFLDLQKMIHSITKMDEEIYTARIKEEQFNSHQQRVKYEMLASQINPHFLYNTLETIRMKALNVDDRDVANAIKLLGKSMRHVLDNSLRTVTLESELEYIRIYLQIQHIRFGERIQYNIQVSDDIDCKQYYILPLLLQPIVENAVSHGLEAQTGVGNLTISIDYFEDKLQIKVKDNGQGISSEEVEILNKNMQKEELTTGESIGLHNIYQRIRLFYGENYGISLYSKLNEGTIVIVSLPKTADTSVDLNQSMFNR